MNFALTEEQEALRRQARQLMKLSATSAATRQAIASEAFDATLWARMVELGWTALLVPEDLGGLGLGFIELTAVMEETGGALACAPLFSTVCLATNVLLLADGAAPQRQLLTEIAAGRLRATVGFAQPNERDGLRAVRDGGDVRLTGELAFVVDGDSAELLLVRATEADGAVGVYALSAPVSGHVAGLVRRARPTLDGTRRLADLRCDDVRLPAAARLPGDGAALLDGALARTRIALAAESLGGAERCLAMSVEYAKTRVQFSRAIGSFQAVKHRCADLLMLIETARSAVTWAAYCAATDDPELAVAASIAHSYVGEAYLRATGDTIQIHGGMGFTWEHDAHLYFRRARGSAELLGDARGERERLAQKIGLT
jgi:alkylation response protein AidB-like acyl-CoA dehydrogenase